MFRIDLSIKAGKIAPSTILRRLGTQNRKISCILLSGNWVEVYGPFTYNSEQFNQFAKWLFFGNESIIAVNVRFEQSKIIKYNQLVANMTVFHIVASMTKVLNQLQLEGNPVTPEAVAGLGPCRTNHLNRLGKFTVDKNKKARPPSYDLNKQKRSIYQKKTKQKRLIAN